MSLALQTRYVLGCDQPLCLSEAWSEGDTPKVIASLLRSARAWGWRIPSKGKGPYYCPDHSTDSGATK